MSTHGWPFCGSSVADDVDVRHLVVAGEVGRRPSACDRIGLRLDLQIEHAAARVLQRPGVRIVDRLAQHATSRWSSSGAITLTICARQPTRTRSDWRSSVLTKPPTSSASSRLYSSSSSCGANCPLAVGEVAAARAVPDVPFVEREPEPLRRLQHALHVVADGARSRGSAAPCRDSSPDSARVLLPVSCRRVAVVVVERDAVDLVVALLEHLAVPDEVGRQDRVARAAGDQLAARDR